MIRCPRSFASTSASVHYLRLCSHVLDSCTRTTAEGHPRQVCCLSTSRLNDSYQLWKSFDLISPSQERVFTISSSASIPKCFLLDPV